MKKLTYTNVIDIHNEILRSTTEDSAIKDYALLDSAINSAYATFDGVEFYKEDWLKIARIGSGIASNHAFVNGNKRTAFEVILILCDNINLKINVYKLQDLILEISSSIITINTFIEKFKDIIIKEDFTNEDLLEKIVKLGNKWQIQSEKGRNMGTYDTKAEAEKRLQQVHYFKYKNEDLKDDAKKTFGIIKNWELGLYINTDGTILDGSGKAFGSDGYSRSIDHREISDLWDSISGDDAMIAYMNEGNIRLKPEAPGIELIYEPTLEQYEVLEKLIKHYLFDDEFYLDISDANGNVIYSKQYSGREIIGLAQDIKNYFANNVSATKLLKEDTRATLISKSRNAGDYKDKIHGKNRFERKKYSKVANAVKEYNQLDMNDFFKRDILTVKVPVQGETDSYTVSIKMEGVLAEIAKNVKSNKNKFEFKTVIQALTKIFNTGNVYVNCTCKDYCLHPDTKIKLLNGTTVTVEELESIVNSSDKPIYLYSVDTKGDFKPGKIKKVWVSDWVNEMIEITLDNGKTIVTTRDHPYMLRNGTYTAAENLQVGQSLMPLYFGKTANGYETVKANSIATTEFFSTYKQVANALLQDEIEEAKVRSGEDKIAIHHKDFNKNNNSPENLYPMGFNEHYKYHYDHVKDSPAFKAFKDAGEEYRKLVMDRSTPEYQKQAAVASMAAKKRWDDMTAEERQIVATNQSVKTKKYWEDGVYDTEKFHQARQREIKKLHTPEIKAKAVAGVHNYWDSLSPEERQLRIDKNTGLKLGQGWNKGQHLSDEDKLHKSQAALNRTPEEKAEHNKKIRDSKMLRIFNKMLEDAVELTAENYESYRKTYFKYAPPLSQYFNSIEEAIKYFNLNHKISSIKIIKYDMLQPVYDIAVEDYHNFYVDAGIILHNCYNFDHWNIINNVSTEDTAHDPGPGKNIRNPKDDKGRGCKHVLLVLNNLSWLMHVASVIRNYILYAEDHMQKAFLKLIFPKIYGIPADEMIEQDLVDDEKFLDSSKGLIDAINAYGAKRGQYKPGTNKNPVTGTGGRTKKEPKETDGETY